MKLQRIPRAAAESDRDLRTAIDLSGVSMVFASANGPVTALSDISLSIGRNRFISIVGRSGCGKSTLLRIICGLAAPTAGTVAIGGLSPSDYRKERRFGFVFQDATLLPWRTALDNIALPMKLQGSVPSERWLARARELRHLVRLDGFGQHYPNQLSGGMRQRVSIARALSYDPDILLMDEPFGALDDFTRQDLAEELVRLSQERSRTIVFVTHNLAEAVFLSDEIVVMASRPGRVRAVIDIDLPRPREPRLRYEPEFVRHLAAIEKVLSHEG